MIDCPACGVEFEVVRTGSVETYRCPKCDETRPLDELRSYVRKVFN